MKKRYVNDAGLRIKLSWKLKESSFKHEMERSFFFINEQKEIPGMDGSPGSANGKSAVQFSRGEITVDRVRV